MVSNNYVICRFMINIYNLNIIVMKLCFIFNEIRIALRVEQ